MKNSITINNEICLKGILALLIIISHSSLIESIYIGKFPLHSFNYFIVAIFFYISGYGLEMKRKHKKEFDIINKSIKLIIPFIIVAITWLLVFEKTNDINDFIKVFIFNKYIPYCWYVKTQLILYFIYWVSIKLLKQYNYKDKMIILFIFIGILLYTVIQYFNNDYSTTYITVFCFGFGFLYGFYEDKIKKHMKKSFHMKQMILLLIVIFSTLLFPREENILSYIIINIVSGIFCFIIINTLYFVNYQNKVTLFLGSLSYYIYIVQAIAQCTFQKTWFCNNVFFQINNSYLQLLCTFCLDLIVAIILKMICDKIIFREGIKNV